MDAAMWMAMAGALALVAAVLLVLAWQALRGMQARLDGSLHVVERLAEGQSVVERLAEGQAMLGGRVAQLSDTVQARLDHATRSLEEGMIGQVERTRRSLSELEARLAVMDAAQAHLAELSQQVVGLQAILSNKQARGAFGEVQLEALVQDALPPSAYQFQAVLPGPGGATGTSVRADCLLRLPHPPGPIVVDAKFPLEGYRQLVAAQGDAQASERAGRAFSSDVRKHLRDIASRYIVPGQTADSALMFLPSEAVFAELHARFPQVVEEGHRLRVWIVSPSTLMATLITLRAVLKDARVRQQAGVVQAAVRQLLDDVRRLDERVGRLQQHFQQASADLHEVRVSSEKIARQGHRIDALQLEESAPVVEAGTPTTGAPPVDEPSRPRIHARADRPA